MFEGVQRSIEWSPPDWWWGGWFLFALSFAVFRQWSPRYLTQLGWAWTDTRLLLQFRGDYTAPWYSGWWQNATAGFGLSLAVAGMVSRWLDIELTSALALRLWLLWLVLMMLRWSVARLWEGLSEGEVHGREWGLLHRMVNESSAWILAPMGLFMTIWGPRASFLGLVVCSLVWAIGWLVRQQRTIQRITRLRYRPLEGIFYLCALEILPVAVLIRAWKW